MLRSNIAGATLGGAALSAIIAHVHVHLRAHNSESPIPLWLSSVAKGLELVGKEVPHMLHQADLSMWYTPFTSLTFTKPLMPYVCVLQCY